jgi:hypothetical protein
LEKGPVEISGIKQSNIAIQLFGWERFLRPVKLKTKKPPMRATFHFE